MHYTYIIFPLLFIPLAQHPYPIIGLQLPELELQLESQHGLRHAHNGYLEQLAERPQLAVVEVVQGDLILEHLGVLEDLFVCGDLAR